MAANLPYVLAPHYLDIQRTVRVHREERWNGNPEQVSRHGFTVNEWDGKIFTIPVGTGT